MKLTPYDSNLLNTCSLVAPCVFWKSLISVLLDNYETNFSRLLLFHGEVCFKILNLNGSEITGNQVPEGILEM